MNTTGNANPTTYKKAVTYARALSRWIKAGRPVRNEDEIRRVYEECCLQCEQYEEQSKICKCCGCKINLGNNPVANKIAMETETCPLGKW